MRVSGRGFRSALDLIFFLFLPLFLIFSGMLAAPPAWGQGAYQAQVRGIVSDQSGAIVASATVTITNNSTNIAQVAHTDEHGESVRLHDQGGKQGIQDFGKNERCVADRSAYDDRFCPASGGRQRNDGGNRDRTVARY